MKKTVAIPIVMMLAVLFVSKGDYSPSSKYVPVFMTRTDLEKSVSYKEGKREMKDPGKIYIHGDRIFVNEKYKGVHIIDNSNPANPLQTGFILAPGCIDMAVKENIIYMDNAVDFVAFDMQNKTETKRIKNFFPERKNSPDGSNYDSGHNRPKDYILIGWRKVKEGN